MQGGTPPIAHAVWSANEDRPEILDSGIGVLLTQFETSPARSPFRKEVADGTVLALTKVGDDAALWIEGAPHRLTYRTEEGVEEVEVSRLAANVLVWESDGVTLRLESGLDLSGSRRIAESLKAMP